MGHGVSAPDHRPEKEAPELAFLTDRLSRRTAAAGLCLVAALTAPAWAGAGAPVGEVKALYGVSFIGIPIARGSLAIKVERGAYAAKLHISTAGLARIVSSEESYVNAKGYFGPSLVPTSYELMSRGDKVTQVEMALTGGNVRNLRAIPELTHTEDRVPVTSAAKRHVVDPLSAAVIPVVGKSDEDVCDRTLPVFDGWTRYDIALSYAGTEPIAFPGYSGDAVHCSARWVPVAGHREGSKATNFMRDNRDIDAWYFAVPGTKVMIPFKVSVRTMRGQLLVTATKLGDDRIDGLAQAN
jgi:hypothetical protein